MTESLAFDFAAAGAALGAEIARRALSRATSGNLSDCDSIKNEMMTRILDEEKALQRQGVDDDQIKIFINCAGRQVLHIFAQFRATITATDAQPKGH